MTLRALIFDVDGTLAETEELHRAAFNTAFRDAGLPWHWSQDDYCDLLKTTGGKERIARFCAENGTQIESIPRIHANKTSVYGDLLASGAICLRPGVARVIADARAMGLALGIATTTSRPNVDALCATCFGAEALAVFDVIVCGEDVAHKKPAPDVYHTALTQLAVSASEALAFEDSAMGLEAATRAGLRCVVTPSIYCQPDPGQTAWRQIETLEDISLSDIISQWDNRAPA